MFSLVAVQHVFICSFRRQNSHAEYGEYCFVVVVVVTVVVLFLLTSNLLKESDDTYLQKINKILCFPTSSRSSMPCRIVEMRKREKKRKNKKQNKKMSVDWLQP